ncbi:hypothetical protein KFE98_16385 [bacterium SCSIO 12741]|nr:hypothetical protein KFE98_16385 [bacterium SCSIO 12741]
MKHLLIFTFIITSFLQAISCESGSQIRLFPVGISEGDVIGLEVFQRRDAVYEFRKIYWKVNPRLVRLDQNGNRQIIHKYVPFRVMDSTYVPTMDSFLLSCQKDWIKLSHFQELHLDVIEFGTFEQKCGPMECYADTVKKLNYWVYQGDSQEIVYPEPFLKRMHGRFNLDSNTVMTDSLFKAMGTNVYRWFGIGSYRQYRSGEYQITVLTLGYGDSRFRIKNRQESKDVPKKSASRFMYNEPILHHGHTVDFLFVSKF